ncbi:MAG: hypothetical protein ACLGHS_14865, partial [Actinomycetes bacterium]
LAVVWGIRRFAVGITGPVLFFSDAAWTPPLPHPVLAAVFAAAVAGLGAYVARAELRSRAPEPALERAA